MSFKQCLNLKNISGHYITFVLYCLCGVQYDHHDAMFVMVVIGWRRGTGNTHTVYRYTCYMWWTGKHTGEEVNVLCSSCTHHHVNKCIMEKEAYHGRGVYGLVVIGLVWTPPSLLLPPVEGLYMPP